MNFAHSWTGWNGTVVPLTGGRIGAVQLNARGVVGLGSMDSDSYVRQTPALSGQRFTGFRELARDVFWPLTINGSNNSWSVLQGQFWATMRPGKYGVWRVTAPDGSYRELTCRYVPAPSTFTQDPAFLGIEFTSADLVADDPWWKGPQFLAQFQPVEDVRPFFAVTSDRVFNLMSSSTVASAAVSNSGDVEAWPKYTITGPVSEFSATISGGIVSSVTNVVDGAVLVIDTDPTVQRAVLTVAGVDSTVTRDLVGVDWRPVPAGGSVSLDVTLQGTGSLVVSFLPRFYRAW
jgi:hypothetical protein